MTTHIYSSLPLSLRIGLVTIFTLLFATSGEVAAQTVPSITVHDVVVAEGNAGTTTQATFVVALSNTSTQTVSCNFATSPGTATAGSDYVTTSGSVSFAPGDLEKPVVVQIIGDNIDEVQETFFLDISNVQNATVGSSRGTGFINDDDGPTISINDVTITEGNSGTKNATFTLTLSGPSVESIAIRATTAPGTATAGIDYATTNAVFIFGPGTVSQTLNILIIGDTNEEPDETFFVNLSEPFGTTIADGQGVGTILDDDRTLHLLLEESGPSPQQVAAFESLLFTRDPFKVKSIADWFNLPAGQNTLVLVFAQNLQLNQGEGASAVTVNLVDANNQIFDVPATDVRGTQNAGFTQVMFRLPDNLAAGVCKVTLKAHGETSNQGTIRISP